MKKNWEQAVDVRAFIQENYTPYEGDQSFLQGPTEDTKSLWNQVEKMINEEILTGSVSIDGSTFSGIDNYGPGYIDREKELIVGLQTDTPLKRTVNPFGGIRMVEASLKAYDLSMEGDLIETFKSHTKTHNEGVFDAYTDEMKMARNLGLLTGLPDAYGRGRIIGDYRRIALYGMDQLIAFKKEDIKALEAKDASEEVIRLREEAQTQLRAMKAMISMAGEYGYDISKPASDAQSAIQHFYFGYLAAIKENNGAAMSLGRNTAFLDIYIEKDIAEGKLTEQEAQALIDQLVIKLRMVRHLRTPEYNELFAGDPNWVTEALGGMGIDGRTHVTKTTYRFLHTLRNLGAAPEPNMTVLWSKDLPAAFKAYCMEMSIDFGAIQYENDDLMRPVYGDDYGIACCVSAMGIGKAMQFFGARANLPKALLYAINGGRDELKTDKEGQPILMFEGIPQLKSDVLDYDEVYNNFKLVVDQLAKLYVNTMNTIHYMHDKYAYEASQMALHDLDVIRYMAFGVAGVSILADALSAIKYSQVKVVRDENGISTDFEIAGDFPKFGNDIDEVDELANLVVTDFSNALKQTPTYRGSEHTLSILTITSNVVYGKKTGATPDGRKYGAPFAPGANPMHGRDERGALASLNSVAKLPYENVCQDGISNTFSIVPGALGKEKAHQVMNLVGIMDGYFNQKAFHLNVNVFDKSMLEDAMAHPEKYPNLTIRVSGYAVHFNRLTKEQQKDVISRTFHNRVS